MMMLLRRRLVSTLPRSFLDLEKSDAMVAPLARSVRLVGSVLGETMTEHEGPRLRDMVDSLRNKARNWREGARFEEIVADVGALSSRELRDVARAFAHFLALANAAEQEHRVLRLEQLKGDAPLPPKLDSCAGTIAKVLEGNKKEDVLKQLSEQHVEIVLTAHPTEVHRRTLLTKHRRVTELVGSLEGRAEGYEKDELVRELKGVVGALWGSDDVRRAKPTPQKEARGGLAIVETSLWDAVPNFLRRLDAVLMKEVGAPLPLSARPLRFASWMGGDRDGNPNVTARVTEEVVRAQRRKGAELYLKSLEGLRLDLSVREATDDVWEYVGGGGGASEGEKREPYKALVDELASRLEATIEWADGGEEQEIPPLFDTAEFMETLVMAYESLVAKGYQELADGRLKDAIRRVGCFGLQLAKLDVRQESTRHTNAVDALVPGYKSWSDDEKIAYLSRELNEIKRPLLHAREFDAVAKSLEGVDGDVLATCRYVASAPPNSFCAYVISQSTSAADVLAVEFLLKQAGTATPPRIVPLFETLNDLTNAPDSLRALFSAPGYLDRVGRTQEIMVGYSDSAKDAGRLAAMWAQYSAQEAMLSVAQEFGVELTFFHGKGGTVGRGGNPQTYAAVLAHPPNTIQGRFRVTEQGEMIAFNFGEPRLAVRTLDVYTAGVLRDAFRDRAPVKPEWRETMARLSEVSCETYRGVVRNHPSFVPYFRAATPELELGALNVGSRPAKRNPTGGVESLRAIPWIFAWSQTRLNLPAWLGVDALQTADPAILADMYANWSWFRTNVDLIETLIARTEPVVAKAYDDRLVEDEESKGLGDELRAKLEATTKALVDVTGRDAPASDNKLLQRALKLRNPYVDVLNVIQIEALARRRTRDLGAKDDSDLNDALLVAINGIAAGLRNSG